MEEDDGLNARGISGILRPDYGIQVIGALAVLILLWFISTQNFLLFHTFVEIAGIAVAFAIFIIIWNSRKVVPDAFFLIIGISFLFIGGIDLVHTLAYKGMGIFSGNNADLPTQLWIAARYFQSITFLIATLFIGRFITRDRKYDTGIIIAACTAASALLFASIFAWQIFPQCFVEGSGLTQFKIYSEYLISLILVVTIVMLFRKREHFDPAVWRYLIAAQVFLILGELAFTSYVSVYGFMNMLGHLFRLLSVYLFYRAFVVIALTRPYDLLLRNLKRNEYTLNERFKELNCLYGISTLMERPEISLDEIGNHIVILIPPAMQYPEIARARIVLNGKEFQTQGFHTTPWMLAREILVGGNPVGRTEVCYLEERPALHEGPFMQEERYLVNAIAERMGHIINRMQAEETLRESEEKYRSLFENMLEGFAYCRMIYDDEQKPADWVYLDTNRAFGDLTGLHNITGKRVLEAIPDIRKLTPELFETYGRVASTGNPEKFEIDFKPLGKWLNVSVFSPQTGYFVAVFEDITKRKQIETALHNTTEELNQFFTVALDLLCIADTDGYFRKLNRAFETTLGYPLDELMAHRFLDLVHPDDLNSTLEAVAALKNQEEVVGFENRYRCSDGSWRWIEWRSFPSGNLIYAAARDITERKLAEETLRRARDFYLKVLDDFPNPIWRADVHGKCDYFNKDWLSFTGRSLEQELGDGWAEGVHPGDLDRCLKIYRDNFTLRKPFEMEYRLRYHDGTYHWLFDSGKPFYTPDGEFAGYIGSCYDIQGRRQAEDALLQVNRKLNLLSSITRHDINNQLFSLKAFLELSKETLEDPAQMSEYILKAERAADAIERQIVFTKEYQDLGVKAPAWQSVEECVEKARATLHLRDIRVLSEAGDPEVYADPLLEKVFYNLIDNALRYGGAGMTEIRITATESDSGFVIAVEDNGIGISSEDKKRLFERGFGKHTGLGLFLSKEILAITGITIMETGEPGKGARFEILVPKGAYRISPSS